MENLSFEAIVSGRVNGAEVAVNGLGDISEADGLTVGRYDISKLPPFYAPGLLTACILTGYPNATATPSGQRNPFQGRSYDYRRSLRFSSGQVLTYTAEIRREPRRLLSHFRLDGSAPVVSLPDMFVQEIDERWSTDGDGQLRGAFSAPWLTEEGIELAACATSEYHVAALSEINAHRRLKLHAITSRSEFRLRQESRLVS